MIFLLFYIIRMYLYSIFIDLCSVWIFTATGGALAAGAAFGWTSPTETLVYDPKNASWVGEYGFNVSSEEWSWVGSIVTLGAAFVCLFIGTVTNFIGRKLTMLLLVIPFTIGWALVIWASNVSMLYVGRLLLGISGGAFCITAPMYTAEIAQSEIRGTLGSYFQLMMVIGILFVYSVGMKVNVFVLSVICACIPLVFGAVFVFMPETPLYLISKGKKEDAIRSLKWLRGSDYDYTAELADMQAQHEENKANKVSIGAALARRATLKALFISLGLMCFQQMSGINAVIFYTKGIFEAANTGIDSGVATIIVGVMQVIAVFVSSIVVDKLGRRLLLIPSVIVMGVCTFLLGIYFYMKDVGSDVSNLGWVPIASLCVFIVLFSLGYGPIPWLMMGELFAPDVKGVAGSFVGTFNWLLAFLITKTFAFFNRTLGNGQTFWLFTAFCVVGVVFTILAVPETKGKSLPEIQRMLNGEKVTHPESGTNGTNADSKF